MRSGQWSLIPRPRMNFSFFFFFALIFAGLYAPTSGTATVDGFDINTSMDSVRERLGLCPQFSMLFPEIRVMEHLLLFGQVRPNIRARLPKIKTLF